jgi:hypothetical protein
LVKHAGTQARSCESHADDLDQDQDVGPGRPLDAQILRDFLGARVLHASPPADPESAALDLIVQAAEAATGSTAFRAVLQDLAGALHAEGALAGLTWRDARLVAAAISYDSCVVDDPARSLRSRSASLRAGRKGLRCAELLSLSYSESLFRRERTR